MLDKLIGDIKEKMQKKSNESSGEATNPNAKVPNESSLKELLNAEGASSDATEEIQRPKGSVTEKKIFGFKIPDDPKEKKTFFIRIGLIVLIGYFAVDTFILGEKPEEVAPDTTTAAAPIRKKKRKKPTDVAPVAEVVQAEKPAEDTAVSAAPIVEAPAEVAPEVSATAPVVTENIQSEQEKVNVEEIVYPETKDKNPESEATSGELNLNTGQIVEELPKPEKPATEVRIEDKLNKIITQVDESSKSELKEYVAPPDYEIAGRGLVYNCQNKHWACIDRENYFKCEKNNRWLSAHKKSAECAAQNVYASDSDCQTTQKYNVQELVKPKGCKP